MHPLHALEEFHFYLAAERGLSQNTIDGYTRDIRRFLGEYKRLSVSSDEVIMHLGSLQEGGLSSSSLYRVLVALKVFYRFLFREDLLRENPTLSLDSPKLWTILPDVMNEEEIHLLLTMPDTSSLLGLRDKVAMLILYATGIRVSELCFLKREEVSEEGLRIHGKGKKIRIVPIAHDAARLAKEYIEISHKERGPLLLSKNGYQLDRHQIWRRIRKYAKEAGLIKRISPHTFRHTYATHLLDNGADLRVIQEFLGHAEISTTERYTHLSKEKMKEKFTQFHPR